MKPSLTARLTRNSGTSFYGAFLVLPPAQRRALYALYAFCRVVDDCVDEPDGARAAGLDHWKEEIERCFAGQPETELGRALARSLERFPMPEASFHAVIEGCRMDLEPRRYRSFAELREYCELVASAVGLAAIEIFGYREPATRAYARELGVALQLTNILRDVTADARRGRLYVPADELAAHGVSREGFVDAALHRAPRTAAIDRLLEQQGDRARRQYLAAEPLLPSPDRRSMRPARIMAATYREILSRLSRRGFPFGERLRLSEVAKAWITLRTMAGEPFA